MTCANHPVVPAAGTAAMPSTKQADGSYFRSVPLCAPCLGRVAAVGFQVHIPDG